LRPVVSARWRTPLRHRRAIAIVAVAHALASSHGNRHLGRCHLRNRQDVSARRRMLVQSSFGTRHGAALGTRHDAASSTQGARSFGTRHDAAFLAQAGALVIAGLKGRWLQLLQGTMEASASRRVLAAVSLTWLNPFTQNQVAHEIWGDPPRGAQIPGQTSFYQRRRRRT